MLREQMDRSRVVRGRRKLLKSLETLQQPPKIVKVKDIMLTPRIGRLKRQAEVLRRTKTFNLGIHPLSWLGKSHLSRDERHRRKARL